MGRTIQEPNGVPPIKTIFIYAEDATRMNSSGTSFLSDGDEFVSYSGTGASDDEAGFPLAIPDDFKSVIDISIEHTTSITTNTVNYKIDVNENATNYCPDQPGPAPYRFRRRRAGRQHVR